MRPTIATAGSALRSGTTADLGVERRRGYRARMSAVGRVRVVSATGAAADEQSVFVFDVSVHGVGFASPVPFDVDAILHLDLPSLRHLGSRLHVCFCRPRSDGMFDVGCKFA